MANTSVPSAQPILEEQSSGMELQPYIGHDNQNHVNRNQLQMIIQDLKNQIFVSDSSLFVLRGMGVGVNFNSC